MALRHGDSTINQEGADKSSLVLQADGADRLELPSGDFIANASMTREGNDLVLQTPNGETVVVEGYFTATPAPTLHADNGTALTPNLVDSFLRSPMEYAANETASDASPVGAIEEVKGNATVTRADGTVETITAGTPIYEGDIIETDATGAVNIVFIDETSMAISQNAKIAVNEYTFDPSNESGTTNLSVLRGLFVFTSGLIGRDDPDDVVIETPVGSIGIRGTIIAGEIIPGGVSSISVIEGAIVVHNGAMEVTLSQQFETVQIGGMDQPMNEMGVVPASSIASKYHNVGEVLPSLFSVIQDSVQGQDNQTPTQQNQTAPSTQQGPSDDGANNQLQSPQKDAVPQQPSIPSPVSDIITLDNKAANNLPADTIVSGNSGSAASSSGASHNAPVTPPSSGGHIDAGAAPSTGTSPVDATTQPPPSVIAQPQPQTPGVTTPAALSVSVSTLAIPDTTKAGGIIANIATNGTSLTFDNGTTTSTNGYFTIDMNGGSPVVRLTTAGQTHLDSSLDPVQLGNSLTIIARNSSDEKAETFYIPVTDASAPFSLDNAGGAGISHITNNLTSGMGYSIAALGDMNRDGFDDFIIGNNSGNASNNVVYVMNGNASQYTDGTLQIADPAFQTININSGALANPNTALTGIGDINGDGKMDFAVGQSQAQIGATSSGNIFLVSGETGHSSISFAGTAGAGSQIGASVSGIGDFNNDGYDDLIVGAPGMGNGNGAAFLIKGYTGALTTAPTPYTPTHAGETSSGFGQTVRGIGDFNGDGYLDYAIAAPGGNGGNGYIDIHYGYKNGGTASSPTRLNGAALAGFGTDILSLGDINGDGMSDIMVTNSNNSGKILLGGNASTAINFDFSASSYTLNGAAGVGDFNGDGHDDMLISLADGNGSKLYLVYGKENWAPELNFGYLKNSENAFEMSYSGATNTDDMLKITGVGDLNGDGRDDFAIGVSDLNGSATGDGGVIVVYGRDETNATSTQSSALQNGQSLVGTSGANTFSTNGHTNVSINAGAGNDTITVTDTMFRSIDGGGGYDTLIATGALDFSNINYEKVSGIEQLQFSESNSVITLTLENIFNLLKTSDGYSDGTNTYSGFLKIAGATANGTLKIDTDIASSNIGADASAIATELEKFSGTGSVERGTEGGFDTYKIGGYMLMIENSIQVDVV